ALAGAANSVRVNDSHIYRQDVFGRTVQHSVRSNGRLHLVYTDLKDARSKQTGVYYLRSMDGGLSWDKPVPLSGDKIADDAQILTDAAGRLYVFYSAGGGIYMIESGDAGARWSEPYLVSGRYLRSRSPSAVITGAGDIQLVWDDAGMIMFRSYDGKARSWNTIIDISNEACASPLLVNYNNRLLYALWLQNGEVVCRILDLERGIWGVLENVSAEANAKLKTTAKACRNLSAAVDSRNNLYVIWSNGRQLLSRTRESGIWSGVISRLTSTYAAASAPAVVFDSTGRVFIAYLEKNKIVLSQYDSRLRLWSKNAVFTLDAPKNFSTLALGGNTSFNERLSSYQQGFDLLWVERENNKLDGTLAFNNRSDEFGAVRHTAKAEENNGPELELTSVSYNSQYLYSPNPSTLYYGGLLPERKEFVIRGKVRGRGDGVRRIAFSPAFGISPRDEYNLGTGEWSVRYSLQAVDNPADITITAYDRAGNASTRIVSVVKDTTPPAPPTWVKIWPDAVSENIPANQPLKDDDALVFVTWTDGQDGGSGVKYHMMGNKSNWWQNAVHSSGDEERADEGENTFYVFAVDRVGNVSLPGTDRILIGTVPPPAPELLLAVTSANYFYGTCTPDVEAILVNGLADKNMTIVTPGVWQYKHNMSDGQRIAVHLQALDKFKNKSSVAEFLLGVDRTPPKIETAEHNASGKVLRIRDRLIVTAQSEVGGAAVFNIKDVTGNIAMRDDGLGGDLTANDGVYTGVYTVADTAKGRHDISVIVRDTAGNAAEKKLKSAEFDSWAELLVDNFEDRGDFYPWKNHAQAQNINAMDKKELENIPIPEGKGVLRVEYEIGEEGWAGIASREFLPRSYYGQRPALQFWLKGSGSQLGRLVVQLLHKDSTMGQNNYDADFSYSVPLSDTQWKKYSVFIPEEMLDGLEQTIKYAIYIYDPEAGNNRVFYLDDLRLVFHQPLPQKPAFTSITRPANFAVDQYPRSKPRQPEQGDFVTGGVITAPYLNVELTPQVLVGGQEQIAKLYAPLELRIAQAYVVWGRLNQNLQSTQLSAVGGNVFKGTYQVPPDLQLGEQSGIVFVQTLDGQVYKKDFYYRVLTPKQTGVVEQLTAQFYPHPLLTGKDIRVRVHLPESVQSQQVMIFLSEDHSKVTSVLLHREKQGVWQGVFALSEDTPPGEYSANIVCKTNDGSFIKKKIKYSVYK
ncbi:hypothetical protein RDn1_001, partial [Candidatus Termititenax dinenymphae]